MSCLSEPASKNWPALLTPGGDVVGECLKVHWEGLIVSLHTYVSICKFFLGESCQF